MVCIKIAVLNVIITNLGKCAIRYVNLLANGCARQITVDGIGITKLEPFLSLLGRFLLCWELSWCLPGKQRFQPPSPSFPGCNSLLAGADGGVRCSARSRCSGEVCGSSHTPCWDTFSYRSICLGCRRILFPLKIYIACILLKENKTKQKNLGVK